MSKTNSTLFAQYRDCPICHAPEAVTIPTKAANFFRCAVCNQAVKLNAAGRLVPWLDIYSVVQKRGRPRTKAEGRK